MGQALYRKYRSKKLSELVGQEHIARTLSNALKTGRISHAYLLTGPKGVGKTSVARILAHAVNGLKYDEDKTHLDIIEIDAASNRRIDEIRDIREKVHISPTSAKYKVYIIDEVHMLTKEAFNALLKTLEEPPEHVIFILATTEAHKLPETIVSRTQRFNFKPIADDAAFKHLKNIARAEEIGIDDEALELIVKHGDGSFRDSISLLDQISSQSGRIKIADVEAMLGIAPVETIENIANIVENGTARELLDFLDAMRLKGYHPPTIAKQLGEFYRRIFISKPEARSILKLMGKLIDVPTSANPEERLELILLEHQFSSEDHKQPDAQAKKTTVENVAATVSAQRTETKGVAITAPTSKKDTSDWSKIMNSVRTQHTTLYGTLRMANANFDSKDSLILTFGFAFHKKRLDDAKNLAILQNTAKDVLGRNITVKCKVSPNSQKDINNLDTPAELETISNIFGSAERL